MAWTNDPNGGLSAVPANGGTGFQSWTSSEQGDSTAGFYFLADSTGDGFGDVNSSNGRAFGMFASGTGNTVNSYRKMILGLMVGGSFTVRFATQYRNGNKGVVILNSGTPVFNFDVGGPDQYRYSTTYTGSIFTSFTNTDWIYSGTSVFTLSVHRPEAGVCTFTVLRDADGTDTTPRSTGPISINTNTDVDELQLYTSQTEVGSPNNLYFNFLSAYNAYPA